MCSHYQAVKQRERFIKQFGIEPPIDSGRADLWPGYVGAFIRKHPHAYVRDEAVSDAEALTNLFVLKTHWSPGCGPSFKHIRIYSLDVRFVQPPHANLTSGECPYD